MQRAGCRTVVFYQQNKGSVWLNFLNWSESQKENNNYYDMALGALLWLAIPLKIIITMLWIKVILDMWVDLLLVLVVAPRVFLRVLRFSFLHKNKHYKFQWKQWKRRATSWNVGWSWKSIPTNYLPHHECGTDLPGRVDGRSTPNSWRRRWRLWNLLGSQRLVEVNKSRCKEIRALFTAMQAGSHS